MMMTAGAVKVAEKYNPRDHINARLDEWGRWARRWVILGTGYPKNTVIGRFAKDGGVIVHCTGGGFIPPADKNADAEEVEKAVIELRKRQPVMAEIIIRHYVFDDSLAIIAGDLKISKTMVASFENCAKSWLDAALNYSP